MPKLIVFEGIDGVGKSTLVQATVEMLRSRGEPAVSFDEISGATVLLLPEQKRHLKQVASVAESFLLYLASVMHKATVLKEVLETQHVVMDRYIDSVLAHHLALGLDYSFVRRMIETAKPFRADLTMLVSMEESVRHARVRARASSVADDLESAADCTTLLGRKRAYFEKIIPCVIDNGGAQEATMERIARLI